MSITNYTELQTAVAGWLNKSNLTTVIPDFITLTEADINRRLRSPDTETNYTGSLSGQTLAIPAAVREIRKLFITNTKGNKQIIVVPQEQLEAYGNVAGEPQVYCITANVIKFGPSPDSTYPYILVGFGGYTALSSGAPTNAMLTSHPDVYLYGALTHAAQYLQDVEALAKYGPLYDLYLTRVDDEDKRQRYDGSTLVIRPSGRVF